MEKTSPLTKNQVLQMIESHWHFSLASECIPLECGEGRILVEAQYSRNTLPLKRSSRMDGIAVKSSNFVNGIPDTSRWVIGKDYVRADTGDDFEDAFDTVIAIESTQITGEHITLDSTLEFKPGMNINASGSILKSGDLLVSAGLPLRSTELAALAMGGITRIPVQKKPVVSFIPTGSELVPFSEKIDRGKNPDTNSLMVQQTLLNYGAQPKCYSIVNDDPKSLNQTIDDALSTSDIVIINGGSSKGNEDYNAKILKSKGKILCHWILAAPGRPLCVAIVNDKLVLNIPGPTMATYYVLDWCLRPLIYKLKGLLPETRYKIKGVLIEDLKCAGPMDFLCRVDVYRSANGDYIIQPRPFKFASLTASLCANAQYISPIGDTHHKKGDVLEVEMLRDIQQIPLFPAIHQSR